jgi:hypothetical protein
VIRESNVQRQVTDPNTLGDAMTSVSDGLDLTGPTAVAASGAVPPAQPEDEQAISSWRRKWAWSLAGAALFAIGAGVEAGEANKAVSREKQLASQANNATSQAQFNSLKAQMDREAKNASQAADMGNAFAVVAGVLGGYATYVYFFQHPGSSGTALQITPVPLPGGSGVVLTWNY